MHLILLSGGSGKRLWPLSNDIRSKQFLQVLPSPAGDLESMVQRVYRQINEAGIWDSITVAAGANQKDQLKMQLGKDVNIVIEPERRDTFPAIALACSYLYSERNVAEDEVIAVLPVDPFVDVNYFQSINRFEDILGKDQKTLALMGASPTFPSEKYGYILPSDAGMEISEVKLFKEKPEIEVAKSLIAQGALWNCGVFGLKLGYITEILRTKYNIVDLSYDSMQKTFLDLNKTSFDYEVVEHADNIKVLRYHGKWKDLGTWETLSEEMATDTSGVVKKDGLCNCTHIINEQEIPVIVMGIKNAVVVASRDGILVAEKGETYRLKDFISDYKNRPMFEEKRWGSYKVIEHTFNQDGTEALTKKLHINKGEQISYQYHNSRKEIWTIIKGEAILNKEGEISKVSAGDVIKIDEKEKHGIYAETDIEIIEVQLGSPLIEDDIVRLEMEWYTERKPT